MIGFQHPRASALRIIIAVMLAAMALAARAPSPSLAATGAVDCGTTSLQNGIFESNPGDTLNVTGTCVGTFTIDKPLILQGGTIQGSGSAPALTVAPGSGAVTLSHLTITGGTGVNGNKGIPVPGLLNGKPGGPGGLDIKNGDVTMQFVTITGNSGGNGGDGAATAGSINGGNGGRGGTGGVLIEGGNVTFQNTTVTGNAGGFGGDGASAADPGNGGDSGASGIEIDGGDVTFLRSTITNNQETTAGCLEYGFGGIGSFNGGMGGRGSTGGLFVQGGSVDMIESTISGNDGGCGGLGGPVAISGPSPTESIGGAGGLLVSGGSLHVYNSTVSGNTGGQSVGTSAGADTINGPGTGGDGGGTALTGGSISLLLTTVSGNKAGDGSPVGTNGLGNRGGSISATASIIANPVVNGQVPDGSDCAGTIANDGYDLFGTGFIDGNTGSTYDDCTISPLPPDAPAGSPASYSTFSARADGSPPGSTDGYLKLLPLTNGTNSTPIMPEAAGSPSIGLIPQAACDAGFPGPSGSGIPNPNGTGDLIFADQRGISRTGGACDAGSFELLRAPTVDIVHNALNDTGVSQTDGITSNNQPTFQGSLPGAIGFTATIYDNGTALGTAVVGGALGSSSDFFFKPSSPLADGTHHITATVADPDAGTDSPVSVAASVIIRTASPTIDIFPENYPISSDGSYPTDAGSSTLKVDVQASDAGGITSLSCSDGSTGVVSDTPSTTPTIVSDSFTLATGAHDISCSATGAAGNQGSTTQTMNVRSASNVTITASQPTTYYRQGFTITVTVASATSGGATPTGTVNVVTPLASGDDPVCTITLVDGTGTCREIGRMLPPLTFGGIPTLDDGSWLVAEYGGDGVNSAANSDPLRHIVEPLPISLKLESLANPSSPGQSVTFTATLANTIPNLIGSPVQFGTTVSFSLDGSTISGCGSAGIHYPTDPTILQATATCTTSAITGGGDHTVTATSSPPTGGSVALQTSASDTLTQTVQLPASHTQVQSSLSPSTYGHSVTFTATVSSSAGTPDGTVTFDDNGTDLDCGVQTLSRGGTATCATTSLPAGSAETITASYSGSASFASSSGTTSQTVRSAPLTITANNKTYTFGGTAPALAARFGTLQNGDTGDSFTGTLACSAYSSSDTTDSTPLTIGGTNLDAGTYVIHCTGLSSPNYDITWSDGTLTVNQAETTLTYTGPLSAEYHDAVTVSATLTAASTGLAIAGKSVTFTLGADSCTNTTDSSGNVSCSLTPHQTGSQNIVASFASDTDYGQSSDTETFSTTPEETALTYTGPTVILGNGASTTLTASLAEEGTTDSDGDSAAAAPIPSKSVTLSLDSQSCSGTTDATGTVNCTISPVTVPLGPETIQASFSGDTSYASSSATTSAIVFAFPRSGAFTLGNSTVSAATPATTVTWWGSSWPLQNNLTGGAPPGSFFGFAGTVKTLPTTSPATTCGSTFTTSNGNSASPPSSVPSYMGVLVASKATKSGSTIAGSWTKIVVVKTAGGYASNPGHPGTGTIVATYCG